MAGWGSCTSAATSWPTSASPLKLLSRPGARTRPRTRGGSTRRRARSPGLSHPAIVRARDFGALEDGTPYLAMDAVPGRSLHEWIYLAHTDGLLALAASSGRHGRQVLGGARARARARRHPRRSQAVEHPRSTSRPDGAEPPTRARARSRARVADAGSRRPPARRIARRRAHGALGRRHAGVDGARADPLRRAAHRARDGSLRARLHPLRAAREPRAVRRAPTTSCSQQHQSAPMPDVAAAPRASPRRSRPFVRAPHGEAARGTASSSPRDARRASGECGRRSGRRDGDAAAARSRRRDAASSLRDIAARHRDDLDVDAARDDDGPARPAPEPLRRAHLGALEVCSTRSTKHAESHDAAAPLRAARGRSGRRQEPPRRVALRRGARARLDGAAARALPEDRRAARRRGRRDRASTTGSSAKIATSSRRC